VWCDHYHGHGLVGRPGRGQKTYYWTSPLKPFNLEGTARANGPGKKSIPLRKKTGNGKEESNDGLTELVKFWGAGVVGPEFPMARKTGRNWESYEKKGKVHFGPKTETGVLESMGTGTSGGSKLSRKGIQDPMLGWRSKKKKKRETNPIA